MTTGEMIIAQAHSITGLAHLRAYTRGLLVMGLSVSVGQELLALARTKECDLFGPPIRVLTAVVLLEALEPIGTFAGDMSELLGKAMGDQALTDLFTATLAYAFKNTGVVDVATTWGLRVVMVILSLITVVGMFVARFFVLGVLFPVFFTLAVFSGLLSIPLSAFPKQETIGGWLRNILEVSMWPVVYGFLCTVAVANMKGALTHLQSVDILAMYGDLARALNPVDFSADLLAETLEKGLLVYMKFIALCIGFIYFSVYTPSLARQVVRSESAGKLGGMIAAKALGFGTKAFAFAASKTSFGPALAKFAPLSSSIRMASWYGGQPGGGGTKSDPMKDLNTRQHHAPSGSDGGKK